MSRIPVPYAAGVFLLEGTLDGLGLALLSGLLLLALQLPAWLRLILLATLIQAFISLVVPVVTHLFRRPQRRSLLPSWMARMSG